MAEEGGRGSVGNEIFERVEQLVNNENMRRTDAFKQISSETGRREGTVAANYYRVARQRGAELAPRVRRGGSKRTSDSVDAALQRALDAVEALATVARAQEDELEALRGQSEQLDRLRRMLNG